MENEDILDIYTDTDGEMTEVLPQNVGRGNYGQPIGFNRAKEVARSNPARST